MKSLVEQLEDNILGLVADSHCRSNATDSVLTPERFDNSIKSMMAKSLPPPPQIVVTENARFQFRKPVSKKRRIRRKWAARAANWRPRSLKIGNVIYMHPKEFKKLQSEMERGPA